MGLKAPRFAGDATLEKCLAGTHRMLIGEPSHPSVRKIQQALIDSGYGLPIHGPDGIYGSETEAAVHQYKADRKISPSDGVVGPLTIASLDDKFKNEMQPLPPSALGPGELDAESYIDAVRDVETAYSSDTPEQILTRLRQMYYPGTNPSGLTVREVAFDQLMLNSPIHETDGVTRRLVSGGRISQIMFKRLTDAAYDNAAPPLPPDNPGPNIVDVEGNRVDIGHALLTIDALTHTTTGLPYTAYGVPSIDPAWWVADVGSGAVWAELDAPEPPKVLPKLPSGEPDVPAYWKMSAPDADLFGDVDGFSILELWKSVGGTLSNVLTQYYLGGAGIDAAHQRRFRTFIGAHFGSPGTGTDPFPGAARAFWLKRINRFNDLFAAGPSALIQGSPPPGKWKYSEKMFDRFLSWLFTRLAIETSLYP
jgi:peptidoglycan hydrolase-like protein with peptidoglycan-binding domain